MKASLKLREDETPLLRTKLPVALLSVPAVASLTAGDPADLRLALATASPTLPSLRLSYSPLSAATAMAVEVNTAGDLSFSLVLKPSLGTLRAPSGGEECAAALTLRRLPFSGEDEEEREREASRAVRVPGDAKWSSWSCWLICEPSS
ncbi:hypothetical protein ABZP36_012198 [Zizania latifolia]